MRRAGLFVGVDKYKNGISSLNCSCNDAKKLSFYFAGQFDEVNYLHDEDAHCENILDEVTRIVSTLSAGDLFVFYFAGHGREFNGEHFLVGPTGRSQTALYRRGSVAMPELLDISNKKDLNRLFILDCCRSDIIAGRGEAFVCSDTRDPSMLKCVEAVTGTPPLIINSCSAGQQAFELKDEKHGVFTKALLDVLEDAAAPVSDLDTLLKRLDKKIQEFIPPGKEQCISLIGNTNLWNRIPLCKSWKMGSVSQKRPTPPEPVKVEKTVAAASPAPAESEQKLNAAEVKEYFQFSVRVKQFLSKSLDEADKLYLEQELKSAEKKYQQKKFREAYRQMSVLTQWCAEKERKYSLKQLEESISANAKHLHSWLPDTFNAALELAHNYWFNELWDEAEAKYHSLREILQRAEKACKAEEARKAEEEQARKAEEARKAQIWESAEKQGLKFSEDKTILLSADKNIKTAVIPDGVTTIGDKAFWCSSLTSIHIPDSVTSIEKGAFNWCNSLTSIHIPDSVTTIGDRAFFCCRSLTSIHIPDSVTTIGEGAFSSCRSLTSINIPDSVTTIGDGAFGGCPCLKELKKKYPHLFPSFWGRLFG